MEAEPNEETTAAQTLPDFTTFAFGAAGTLNSAPTPPVVGTTNNNTTPPARTDLHDYLHLENTYINNRTTPLHYT
eukprot:8832349-Ditylum_brightwellii.AAC.1